MHDHEHDHEHGHEHPHRHVHDEKDVKSVCNRLSRIIGHLESIKRMVEDHRDCSEVLIQLSAVRAALNRTGLIILKNHIDQCIVEAVASGDTAAVDELNDAISKFLK